MNQLGEAINKLNYKWIYVITGLAAAYAAYYYGTKFNFFLTKEKSFSYIGTCVTLYAFLVTIIELSKTKGLTNSIKEKILKGDKTRNLALLPVKISDIRELTNGRKYKEAVLVLDEIQTYIVETYDMDEIKDTESDIRLMYDKIAYYTGLLSRLASKYEKIDDESHKNFNEFLFKLRTIVLLKNEEFKSDNI